MGGAVTRTSPCGPRSVGSAARPTSPAHSAMRRAGTSRRSPAVVSAAPETLRRKSDSPTARSSAASRRLRVGWASRSCRAAPLTLPSSATARKSFTSSQEISMDA